MSGADAGRWLSIAEQLLAARDLVGCKEFSERAIDADPLLRGVDQILAIADVLLASQNPVNAHLDWYAILQLHNSADSVAIKKSYRRLALLLHPDTNRSPGADAAFRIVVQAHTVLSDPGLKAQFDSELRIHRSSAAAAGSGGGIGGVGGGGGGGRFWTACPFCAHVYEYERVYQNRALKCRTCQRAFRASETSTPPPIVPGTDMYYCSWGFFPLGFPEAPGDTKLFHPMSPYWGNPPSQASPAPAAPSGMGNSQGAGRDNSGGVGEGTPVQARKKKVARKRVGGAGVVHTMHERVDQGRAAWPGPEAWEDSGKKQDVMVVNPNGEVGTMEGGKVDFVDVDASDDLLGNLSGFLS